MPCVPIDLCMLYEFVFLSFRSGKGKANRWKYWDWVTNLVKNSPMSILNKGAIVSKEELLTGMHNELEVEHQSNPNTSHRQASPQCLAISTCSYLASSWYSPCPVLNIYNWPTSSESIIDVPSLNYTESHKIKNRWTVGAETGKSVGSLISLWHEPR